MGMNERSIIIDDLTDAKYLYGGEDYVLTDEDIELLKQGKIFNFFVEDEYGCTLRYDKTPKAESEEEE